MNSIFLNILIAFLIGLSAAVPIVLGKRATWKARGYSLGHSAARRPLQAHAEHLTRRIRCLHNDLEHHLHLRDAEKKRHQQALEAVMQDCDNRIAEYARRGNPFNGGDLATLQAMAGQLELAASTFAGMRVGDKARFARQMQLEALNLAERLTASLRNTTAEAQPAQAEAQP
jgi:hypothetical protein